VPLTSIVVAPAVKLSLGQEIEIVGGFLR